MKQYETPIVELIPFQKPDIVCASPPFAGAFQTDEQMMEECSGG